MAKYFGYYSFMRRLLSSIWLISTTLVVILVVHLYLTVTLEEPHWFQRSGSLIVVVGIWIMARKTIRLVRDDLNEDWNHPDRTPEGRQVLYDHRAQYRIGPVVALLGIIIWGYGEILIGCL